MTRKDYILIAEALRDKRNCLDGTEDVNGRMYETFWDTAERICGALYRDNARFNREHFLAVVRGEKELTSRPSRKPESQDHTDTHEFVMENCVRCGRDIYDAKINPCEAVCPWCKKPITERTGSPSQKMTRPRVPSVQTPSAAIAQTLTATALGCSCFERCDECGAELEEGQIGLCDDCQKPQRTYKTRRAGANLASWKGGAR